MWRRAAGPGRGACSHATGPDRESASTAGARVRTLRAMTTASLLQATDDTFAAEVLELVDFWAAWCPPCRAMHPILGELAAERDDLRVVSVDVDANQVVAAR